MIEVGKIYKLKAIIIKDGENEIRCAGEDDTYKILAIRNNIATCVNTKTDEPFTFLTSVFIDPSYPEDNKTYMYRVNDNEKSVSEVYSEIDKVINPNDLGFWKQISEEGGGCACASAGAAGGSCGVASCSTGCGCGSTQAAISTGQSVGTSTMGTSASLGPAPNGPIGHIYGAMVNGVPVQGKSTKKKKKKKKANEQLMELLNDICESYDTIEEQEKLYDDALSKLNDYLNKPEMAERTSAMLEYLDLLESIHANSLMDDYIEYARANNIEDLSLDLIESTDDTIIISDEISTWLDRLNFVFADTTDIVYKREGNYKHLIKFDNEGNTLKYKIFKGEECLLEKEWDLRNKRNVTNIFKAISKIIEGYE